VKKSWRLKINKKWVRFKLVPRTALPLSPRKQGIFGRKYGYGQWWPENHFDSPDETIAIRQDLGPEAMLDTIIHETIHSVDNDYKVDVSHKRVYKYSAAATKAILHAIKVGALKL
jgi:hypothetical protein